MALFGLLAACSQAHHPGPEPQPSAASDPERMTLSEFRAQMFQVKPGERRWDRGWLRLVVSPTQVDGETYVPYDLSDAWRELDRMLPPEYVAELQWAYGPDCLRQRNGGDDRVELHAWWFIGFLMDLWLERGESRFSAFLRHLFGYVPPTDPEQQAEDMHALMEVVVCGYAGRHRSGEPPDVSRLLELAREGLDHLERGRRARALD